MTSDSQNMFRVTNKVWIYVTSFCSVFLLTWNKWMFVWKKYVTVQYPKSNIKSFEIICSVRQRCKIILNPSFSYCLELDSKGWKQTFQAIIISILNLVHMLEIENNIWNMVITIRKFFVSFINLDPLNSSKTRNTPTKLESKK